MSEYILETSGLSKSFTRTKAVDNLDLKISKGDIYGFIGKNGAGKTTVIKLISGLIKSNEGIIKLFDSNDLAEGRKKIGVVIENPAYYPYMTALQNVEVQRKMKGINDPQVSTRLLERVGLSNTKNKKVKNFSLGMKQRLGIALALVGDPEFLVLDEPINGLDPMGIKEVRNLILKLNEESGITVLISSHILGELSKMCTSYGVIAEGKLVSQLKKEELKGLVKSFIDVRVDNVEEAKKVIETEFENAQVEIKGNNLHKFVDVNAILVKNNISVHSILKQEGNYEDYFISLMEGEKTND